MAANRLSGLFFVAFGLLLYFAIIPLEIEIVDYGWVRPQTVPNAMAWIMILAGIVLAIRPAGSVEFDRRKAGRAGLYRGLVAASVALMGQVGFLAVSPFLALCLMLAIGERRLVWLVSGAAGLPLAIWVAVTVLLDRPLP